MKQISLYLLCALLMPQLLKAGESERTRIVDNMWEFIDVSLETVPNTPDCFDCLMHNLLHIQYTTARLRAPQTTAT